MKDTSLMDGLNEDHMPGDMGIENPGNNTKELEELLTIGNKAMSTLKSVMKETLQSKKIHGREKYVLCPSSAIA
jgi:hypothetical protein